MEWEYLVHAVYPGAMQTLRKLLHDRYIEAANTIDFSLDCICKEFSNL
ncbi:HTH_48 domain-containing protein [Caenorhabditis elegans]|uniref:HTH_48 domain-containing protein n=1 Tax=Caenorhabditis elegans TaxID=6239 RepID=F5GU53_CAEEL|nr:HTH_48 domain-containing protein [Caenorhabditis elegans]CCD69741.1 HTH_48 domain-containing protein [Caenorhabditis elegans]|eukprot:NP_001256985.1 Uncharacterized protein CELE_F19G12.11 [Caenorhabditis elegans]